MSVPVPLARVTVTIPQHLVKQADRLAGQREASRSAVFAEALRAYLAVSQRRAIRPGQVAEPAQGPYVALSDDALLAELRHRLRAAAEPAPGRPGDAPRPVYDRAKLAELCRRHRIRRLSLFGSVLRDDFGPDSDVDVLVEFEPGHTPGLAIVDVEDELSALFGGRRVDLVTEKSLHRLIRRQVLSSALVQYAA
ncbi:MAG: nucleotidyltransferase domain-containing protein [Gemmatimonadetes bacterium]|nr:nucleotidyltransferase domain-containing protein [Gemmatimonadota bacterium]